MTLESFIRNSILFYKTLRSKNANCQVQISINKDNARAIVLQPYCVTNTMSSDIKNLIKGEDYDKIILDFKNGELKTTKIFVPEAIEYKHPVPTIDNIFNLNALGNIGSLGNSGLGAVMKEEISRQVSESQKSELIIRQKEIIDELKQAITKSKQEIEEKDNEITALEEENDNIRASKQSFNFKGANLGELVAIGIEKLIKKNPKILINGLGIPEERVADLFSNEESSKNNNTIEESPRAKLHNTLVHHLKSLDDNEFNATFALVTITQENLQKKLQVIDYAKQIFEPTAPTT